MTGRHAFIQEAASSNNDIISQRQVVRDDARVRMDSDAIADDQYCVTVLALYAYGAVLPNFEVLANVGM